MDLNNNNETETVNITFQKITELLEQHRYAVNMARKFLQQTDTIEHEIENTLLQEIQQYKTLQQVKDFYFAQDSFGFLSATKQRACQRYVDNLANQAKIFHDQIKFSEPNEIKVVMEAKRIPKKFHKIDFSSSATKNGVKQAADEDTRLRFFQEVDLREEMKVVDFLHHNDLPQNLIVKLCIEYSGYTKYFYCPLKEFWIEFIATCLAEE